jgi:hypothetical protein
VSGARQFAEGVAFVGILAAAVVGLVAFGFLAAPLVDSFYSSLFSLLSLGVWLCLAGFLVGGFAFVNAANLDDETSGAFFGLLLVLAGIAVEVF